MNVFNFNKNVFNNCIWLIVIAFISCNRDKNMIHAINPIDAKKKTDVNNNEKLILGSKDGLTYIFKPSKNKDFYIYNNDMLAYKSDVKVMKEYTAQEVKSGQLGRDITNQVGRTEVPIKSFRANDARYNSCIQKGADLWENNQVVFCIDPRFYIEMKQLIYKAISQWARRTNMRFLIVSYNNVNDFMYITKINLIVGSCNSFVGRPKIYMPGGVNLDPSCELQAIIHEIGHTVGFIHEHQRPKRDNYLTMNENALETIKKIFGEHIYNITKGSLQKLPVYNDSPTFDYNSVMMYGSYPANEPIIEEFMRRNNIFFYTKKNGEAISYPNKGITSTDAVKVNLAYPAFK